MSPQVVDAALEGIALNRAQHRLVTNTTPEVDSLLEHVRELARTATSEQKPHIRAMLELIRLLCESNQAELDCERLIAEAADRMSESGWSVKRAASELRGPLDVIVYPVKYRPSEQRAAVAAVRDVIRRCPREVLDQPSMRGELRDRKLRALRSLMEVPA